MNSTNCGKCGKKYFCIKYDCDKYCFGHICEQCKYLREAKKIMGEEWT